MATQHTRLMYRQLEVFENKVEKCSENFSVEALYHNLLALQGRGYCTKDINTIGGIRRLITADHFEDGRREIGRDRVMIFFVWLLEFIDYMRTLQQTFQKRIVEPLWRFFLQDADLSAFGSRSSTEQYLNGGVTQQTRRAVEYRENVTSSRATSSQTTSLNSGESSFHNFRNDNSNRTSLSLLQKEFEDIKILYDNSEVEEVAKTLEYVSKRWRYLVEAEAEVDPEAFSYESAGHVQRFYTQAPALVSFIRLLPDIMIKCKKCGMIAKKWIDLDNSKVKDLSTKLNTIKNIHRSISSKLSEVADVILKQEEELQRKNEELHRLLLKEERPKELAISVCQIDDNISMINTAIKDTQSSKNTLEHRILKMGQQSGHAFERLRLDYEENILTLYALQKQLAMYEYHKGVLEGDLEVELEVRPSIVRFTNDVQERCEMLESTIEEKRLEKFHLENALLPLVKDRRRMQTRMLTNSMTSEDTSQNEGKWQYEARNEHVPIRNVALGTKTSSSSMRRRTKSHSFVNESPNFFITTMKTEFANNYTLPSNVDCTGAYSDDDVISYTPSDYYGGNQGLVSQNRPRTGTYSMSSY